jgi:hypothetical protein
MMWQFWNVQQASKMTEDTITVASQIGFTIHVSKTKHKINSKKKGNKSGEIKIGNKCYQALGHTLNKRYTTHSSRVGLYKTTGPNVTYGATSLTLMNKTERASMTWENKILIKMYGPRHENSSGRTQMN